MHEPVPDAPDARSPLTAYFDLALLTNMQTMDAKIRPMEENGAGLQNMQDRLNRSDRLRGTVRKYWPQLLIVVFGLGLAAALFLSCSALPSADEVSSKSPASIQSTTLRPPILYCLIATTT